MSLFQLFSQSACPLQYATCNCHSVSSQIKACTAGLKSRSMQADTLPHCRRLKGHWTLNQCMFLTYLLYAYSLGFRVREDNGLAFQKNL